MIKYGVISVILFIALSFTTEVNGIVCWRCSTDATHGEFCNDPFNSTEAVHLNTFQEFENEKGLMKAYCLKLKRTINGAPAIVRDVFYQDPHESKNFCLSHGTTSTIKNQYCEVCSEDKCNGAGVYGPIVALVLVPFAIAKLLCL